LFLYYGGGQSLRIRFRLGTDETGSAPGWWVDDVTFTFTQSYCFSPTPTVTGTRPTATNTPTRTQSATITITITPTATRTPGGSCTAPSFVTTNFPTGHGPHSVAVADLNHDGNPDLV